MIEAPQIKEGLDEILRSCCKLMAVKGFHGTSMRDLAQATGRSLSGLYHYFNNKEHLLFIINYYGFTTLKNTLENMLGEIRDPHERLYALVYNHIGYFASHLDELRIIMFGTQALTLEESRVIKTLKEEYNVLAQDVVQQVYLAKVGRKLDSNKELARQTYLLFGMMNWIFGWYLPEEHGSPKELVNSTYSTFVFGICDNCPGIDEPNRISRSFDEHKPKHLWNISG